MKPRSALPEFVPFLQFDQEIRTIICTTNAIESIKEGAKYWMRVLSEIKNRGVQDCGDDRISYEEYAQFVSMMENASLPPVRHAALSAGKRARPVLRGVLRNPRVRAN